jgi:hypothetical protein
MITLERFAYTPMGTFGRLTYGDFSCYTVERPWDNNNNKVSCIPEGMYTIQKYTSPKFGSVYAVLGETVSLFPDTTHKRSAVLIHPANVMSDLEGCIGLGDSLGYVKSQWGVLNSAVTLKAFFSKLGSLDNIPLNITFKTVVTKV